MPNLLIIHPGAQRAIYGALAENNLTAIEPPPWTRMIAGYLIDRGHDVTILDAEALGLSPDMVAEVVETAKPRLVAIVVAGHQPSASTQQMVGAGAIARAIKARTRIPIIMTGNHPSALPERTLREEAIDYVADGEGPVTLDTLLRLLGKKEESLVPGLVWRYDNLIMRNPLAKNLEDLDANLHGNVWAKLPMSAYRAHNWQVFGEAGARQPYASIYTTLGCPYACRFCMINEMFHSNAYRRFSPEFTVNQIKHLHDVYGVRTLKIADEMFVLNPSHYMAIADGLIAAGLGDKLNIWAYARVDTVRPETLARLRAAGFKWLALGIESGSAHVRDGANKRLRTDEIVETVKTIQKADINVIGNFMFGLRDDTVETMQMTLDLALACRPDFANFYCTMAYPGSSLFKTATQDGWQLPTSWSGYSQHGYECRPLDTEHVDAATVLKFRDTAFDTFYRDVWYRDRVARRFGDATLEQVTAMAVHRVPRRLLGD